MHPRDEACEPGETFDAADGCNTCECPDSGLVAEAACTKWPVQLRAGHPMIVEITNSAILALTIVDSGSTQPWAASVSHGRKTAPPVVQAHAAVMEPTKPTRANFRALEPITKNTEVAWSKYRHQVFAAE